jgi:hypothetical protein
MVATFHKNGITCAVLGKATRRVKVPSCKLNLEIITSIAKLKVKHLYFKKRKWSRVLQVRYVITTASSIPKMLS